MANVKLLPHNLAMEERTDLTLYTIGDWFLIDGYRNMSSHNSGTHTENTHRQGVNMVVILQRNVSNELLTTYLPSTLLMIITFATTFFHPDYFEAAVSVNLTTMLVMTTIFIGEMQTLPSTAYVKMIDIWLVFCQLVPFSEVVLLTAMEYKKDDNIENKDKIKQEATCTASINKKNDNIDNIENKDKMNQEATGTDSINKKDDNIDNIENKDKINQETTCTVSINLVTAMSPIEAWKEKRNTMAWLKVTGKIFSIII